MTAVPTGLPWSIFHSPGEMYFEVQDNEGLEVVTLYYGGFVTGAVSLQERAKAKAMADLIMTSVNAHAPLVEALERIAEHFCESDDCFASADARAALALARGDGA